ncbi:uncharacterized protein BJ171DRAFT_418960, partial [Polychytrium aggregatum]|uniref:uncharacterized protein n=1 Tax=Polychytrium aggregatum TaxID=110093 RepID=UPI0022FE54C2
WFSRRYRREQGLPRGMRKNGQQLSILQQNFEANPYPNRAQKKSIADQTKLAYKQVNQWFENERKKRGIRLEYEIVQKEVGATSSTQPAVRMPPAYK